jgi:hypothetical protein
LRHTKQGVAEMKTLIAVAALIALSGCQKQAEATQSAGSGFQVEKLFTVEGCSVYRFKDSLRYIYYTNCSGSTHTTESCGKGCVRQVDVVGGVK